MLTQVNERDNLASQSSNSLFLTLFFGQTFRDLKAFLKKFKKAQAKDDVVRVAKMQEEKPSYSLAHIVRERYPTFIDSLRDLDDALCLVVLFSTLPRCFMNTSLKPKPWHNSM